jgi:uncharacterized protein
MSTDDNLATIKEIYEAFGNGDVDSILEKLTDDVDWSAEAVSDGAPWYGQRSGKDEVAQFFAAIAGAEVVEEFTPLSFAASENEVMTMVRFRMRSDETGKEAAMNLHHYFRFRDGKVEYYRGSEDTAQTLQTLGA